MRVLSTLVLILPLAGIAGCMESVELPPDQRATAVDPAQAEAAYWYRQRDATSIPYPDFEKLWKSCQKTARALGFKLDRIDYRAGLITTDPMISQQAFEPWRRDVGSAHGLAESTLAMVRRTIHWEVSHDEDGPYRAVPKVLVERYSLVEHRVTSGAQYPEIFALTRDESIHERDLQRDPTLAVNDPVPSAYWYPTGRDPGLERQLANAVRGELNIH